MPNTNIVGRFSMLGIGRRRHSATESVSISSSGAVMSAATVSNILGASVAKSVSKSLQLRYGASMNICACRSCSGTCASASSGHAGT